MKKTVIYLFLMLIFKAGLAQVSLTGKVFDSETGKLLPFATVQLSSTEFTSNTSTDEMGNFRIEKIPVGSYTLSINYLGYAELIKDLELNQDLALQFEMIPQDMMIEGTVIMAERIGDDVPTTISTLNKAEIKVVDQGKDMPFILNSTPSTVVSSDAGNGVGYTGIRIRGIDPTRVNVTINGIPLNDAEGQGVFWVDLPDLASSTQDIQIQRGVGTSTNGAAAFGASVNLRTDQISEKKFVYANLGYGSFNTYRSTVGIGSGRLKNGMGFQARASYIHSDGFIDRGRSDLMSMQLTGDYKRKKSVIKFNVLLGTEETYQAWWGNPQPKFEGNAQELERYINQLYISGADLENLLNSDPKTYNYYTYENEVDHYTQNHYQLFYHYLFGDALRANVALHATTGKGYYEQYKSDETLSDYGLSPYVQGSDTHYTADLQRRLWLDNIFYGTVAKLKFEKGPNNITLGTSINQYKGAHYGEVISLEFTDYASMAHRYYRNDAVKNDANVYLKWLMSFGALHPYIDMQYRKVGYSFVGPDRNNNPTDQHVNYSFFNPKFGASLYLLPNLKSYVLYAIGNREPVRDDFVNSTPDSRPKAEHLRDLELGMEYGNVRRSLAINYYNMQYDDALVVNGQINDVGAYTRVNVPESYRKGWEFAGQYLLLEKLMLMGNYTMSKNKIVGFTEYVDNWNTGEQSEYEYGETSLALSPEQIGYVQLSYLLNKQFTLDLNMKHVGKQYLDNTESEQRKLDAFTTYNASLSWSKEDIKKIKRMNISLFVNNITNLSYAPTGYTFSAEIDDKRESFNYVYPMAGFNWMMKLSMEF